MARGDVAISLSLGDEDRGVLAAASLSSLQLPFSFS